MTLQPNPQTDASQHAAAMARWDDDGGGAASIANKPDENASKTAPSTAAVDAQPPEA